MKKNFIVYIFLFSLIINPFSFTFAKEKVIYAKAEKLANQYIENSMEDESWKGNNPYINWEWMYFYTDDEKNPSYIEFKVSCYNNENCWFILVNFDWNDVAIPIASTTWVWPWKALDWSNSKNKLYYFSPLEQYSQNLETDEVMSIRPEDNIDLIIENDKNLTQLEKEDKIKTHKDELKQKLNNAKQEAKDYKKTEDFKQKKEEIKNQIMKVPEEEFVMKSLNVANANSDLIWNGGTWYIPTAYSSNKFVYWSSYTNCNWKLPCYEQFPYWYNWQSCEVWCAPIAYSMIYGYYDRKWLYPNLVPGTASTLNSTDVENMTKELWGYLWTYCNGLLWTTSSSNLYKGINYAKSKWYNNSTATKITTSSLSTLFLNIKNEINSSRPIIAATGDHVFVVFWYYNTSSDLKIVRANLWGWNLYNMTDINGNIYYGSNVDYNMDSIYYGWSDHWSIKHIVKVIIAN